MQDLNDRNDPEVFSLKAQKPWCVKLQLNKAPGLPDEKQLQCSKDTQAASFYIQKKAGRWQKKYIKKKITASASYPCLTGASLFTHHDLQVTPMSIPRHRRIGVQSNKTEHAPESIANWCWKVLWLWEDLHLLNTTSLHIALGPSEMEQSTDCITP